MAGAPKRQAAGIAARKAAPKTTAPKKAAPKKAAPKKAAPTKAAPKKAAPTKAAPKKAAPKKAAPKKTAPKKTAPTKAAPKKTAPTKAAPTKAAPRARQSSSAAVSVPNYSRDTAFLKRQKAALLEERALRLDQERSQKLEAAALVEEMEPGDIQFDDESGEGGTLAVDREIHLELAAKQRQLVEEIDLALRKIAHGTYGVCERCEALIPKARLAAIPEARICVPCSSGGLSRH